MVSDDHSEQGLSRAYANLAYLCGTEYTRSSVWRGIGGARNYGAAHLSAMTYLMFVDADDEIHPDSLSLLARLATRHSLRPCVE